MKKILPLIVGLIHIFFITYQGIANYSDQIVRAEHPRILLTKERIEEINVLRETDDLLNRLIEVVRMYADAALIEDVIKYQFDGPGDPRLKDQRRASMFRVFNMGLMYHLTGDARYAKKVRDHLIAAAGFPNWGPSHFLNIGEISALMGIGYDWVYDALTDNEKETIRTGIIRHGLRHGISAYNGTHQDGWWVNSSHNWNQVCNGGLTIAALAIADEWPDSAAIVLQGAIKSIPRAMRTYNPDGAWYEGPTYWAYGTTYNGLMLDALQTATGSMLGLDDENGYESLGRSGLYHIQTAGPTGLYFNYADAKTTLYFSPVLFWLARQFDQPVYAWYERLLCEKDYQRMLSGDLMNDDTLDRFLALLVVWYSDGGQDLNYQDLSYDTKFSSAGSSIAAMRDGWDVYSTYLAIKAGSNDVAHAHMDIGSFVLDAKGERWAVDLGGDSYQLPGYFSFSGPRWQYYRCNNFSHNTLVMDYDLQNPNAATHISSFHSSQFSASASIDMTNAYFRQSYQTTRKFEFENRERIIITDEFYPTKNNLNVRWGMVTTANVELFGNEALLTQGARQIRLIILEPANLQFDTISTLPFNQYENQNEGTTMLAVNFTAGAAGILSRLKVEINPTDSVISPVLVDNLQQQEPAFAKFEIYPNPAREGTALNIQLRGRANAISRIVDASGRMVHEISHGELEPGNHEILWDGYDSVGSKLLPGIYIIHLQTEKVLLTRKLIIYHQ